MCCNDCNIIQVLNPSSRQLSRLLYVKMEEGFMAIQEALSNLQAEVTTQLGQQATAIAGLQDAVSALEISETDRVELRRQLDELLAANEGVASAIQAQADALAADNAPEPEPAE